MALLSPKQQGIWAEIAAAPARWNVMAGAVSSGKTYLGYFLKAKRMLRLPPGNCLLVGKTYRSYCRNVLDPMRELWGPELVEQPKGDGTVRLFGRRCYVMGANDERSVQKIQGISLVYCDGDEFATWPESFFQMLKSRLRQPGATCDLTCNPEGPRHWAKTFIDSEAARYWHFTLDDNPFNTAEFDESIRQEYTGLWYRRHILGEWVAAEGAVYDMFSMERHVIDYEPDITRSWVGVDYGTTNPTVFVWLAQAADGRLFVLDEWRHDPAASRGRTQMTDVQFSVALKTFVEGRHPKQIFVDPSAASFRLQAFRDGIRPLAPADNAVVDGIRGVASLLSSNRLMIHKRCGDLIDEMVGYVWDPAAQERGEDAPRKLADHGPDALRYAVRGARSYWSRTFATTN